MTAALTNPKGLLVLFLILVSVVFASQVKPFQGKIFYAPGLGADVGRPTNDCGPNWNYELQWQMNDMEQYCLKGAIDSQIVQGKVSAKQALEGNPPGSATSFLDEVLREIANRFDGF